jgi:hypothetical protein
MNTNTTVYNAQYFIDKFSTIPEEKWCTGKFEDEHGRHCALGHCGARKSFVRTEEANALSALIWPMSINDGDADDYQQPTPKQRILAALEDAKKKGY